MNEGHRPEAETLILHLDDLGCDHGANEAIWELGASGAVTCGSVMVPCPWFPELVRDPRTAALDLGIHLTLTSESAAFRWRPISTADPASGLLDPDGYLWATVSELRAHASPTAVDRELRAQIDIALAAGLDVTHLDHHMGAALAPEFVDGTVQMARDYRLPMLFPADLSSYLGVLSMGDVDVTRLTEIRRTAAGDGLAVGDSFAMPLMHQGRTDYRNVLEFMVRDLRPGVTYLSLHCAAPGAIENIHPNDADWRIGEYMTFSDRDFVRWLADEPLTIVGMREFRDAVRTT